MAKWRVHISVTRMSTYEVLVSARSRNEAEKKAEYTFWGNTDSHELIEEDTIDHNVEQIEQLEDVKPSKLPKKRSKKVQP